MTIKIELVKGPGLRAGERLIMIDGLCWGQTIVSHHGVHGTRYAFLQGGGGIITEPSKAGSYTHEITVRSKKKRFGREDEWRPTEELVLKKVRELIDTGKLRHPDIVKEENRQAAERFKAAVEAADVRQNETFRNKAMETLNTNDPDNEIVSRVVEAMKWAQSQ